MDYLKSLTAKQWLVIFSVIIVLAIGYFFLIRQRNNIPAGPNLDTLLRQGRATQTVNESLNRSEIDKLKVQGRVAPAPEQPRNTLTEEQKNALIKLMSATRK